MGQSSVEKSEGGLPEADKGQWNGRLAISKSSIGESAVSSAKEELSLADLRDLIRSMKNELVELKNENKKTNDLVYSVIRNQKSAHQQDHQGLLKILNYNLEEVPSSSWEDPLGSDIYKDMLKNGGLNNRVIRLENLVSEINRSLGSFSFMIVVGLVFWFFFN